MEMINHMVTCFYIRLLVVWWLLMPSDDTVLSVSGIKRFFVLCVNRELIHEKICHEHTRSKEHQACWFLAGFGHELVIQRGNSVWYKSPFRTEKEASFKVDLHKELWYDFGLGKGGDIITLAKEIYRTQDVSRVLRCIEDKRTVLKPVTVSCPFEKRIPPFRTWKSLLLPTGYCLPIWRNGALIRKRPEKYARRLILIGTGKIILPSLSLIFPEGTNRYFKACIAPKDITCIISSPESGICYIFEGFMDFSVFQAGFSILGRGGLYSVEFCQ